jgi:hypothetical protein
VQSRTPTQTGNNPLFTPYRFLRLNTVDFNPEQLGFEVVVHREHVIGIYIFALWKETTRTTSRKGTVWHYCMAPAAPPTIGSFFNTLTFPHARLCNVRFSSAASMFVVPNTSLYTHESGEHQTET